MDAFATTQWSVVLAAASRKDSTESRQALAALCEAYWYPVYAFVRRQGHGADDARDLAQGYFLQLLDKDFLSDVRPELGRFRSFLIVSVRHFLSNERDRERALKRGGGREPIRLDAVEAERRYAFEPADAITPETLFERRWATTVLERALQDLAAEEARSADPTRFARLREYLAGTESSSYRQAAQDLGLSEPAVKTAVHRLRKRFGQFLRAQIAGTVANPADVDSEIRHLLTTLSEAPAAEIGDGV